MSLKSKSILIIALLFWLKIALIYLIFVQLNNSNKLNMYIGDDNQNHIVLTDLTLLTDKIKTSQIVYNQYLCSQAKDLKNYSSILATVASDLSQVQNKYKNNIIYQKLLNQQIKDIKTRNVLICFVAFLMLLLLLLLFRYIYEMFRLEKKLKKTNDQIQEDLMLKNKIISLLTHEIRTPVNVIRMSSCLVSEKIQDPEVKEIFNSIKYTSNALTLIANQALEVVKLGNHEELIFDIAEFDIGFEIRETIKSLQVIAHSINIDLILDTNIDQPFMINYDRVKLYELLCNVIGNALKFANTKIDISVKKNNQTIFFEILDDGSGVEEEDLNHIFDLNYQGKKARKSDTLSMGLGLYLCKRIIEKSNGTIIVSNSGSSGLKVVFSIDLTTFLNTLKTK
ncbi:MAG: HAMP domain-containing sensor histidine kinase [Flavobacterium sp.]